MDVEAALIQGRKYFEACLRALIRSVTAILHSMRSLLLIQTPEVPSLHCVDVRCNRAKFKLKLRETDKSGCLEIQMRYKLEDKSNIGTWIEEPFQVGNNRTLAPLEGNSTYTVSARTRKHRICSDWCRGCVIKTLISPSDGGGTGVRGNTEYTWGQSASEVWLKIQVPHLLRKGDICVTLKRQRLKVSYQTKIGESGQVEGTLTSSVQLLSPNGGSYWEIERGSSSSSLIVVMEKSETATSIKWGFWRSVFTGDAEIDTHAILDIDPSHRKILQQAYREENVPLGVLAKEMQT